MTGKNGRGDKIDMKVIGTLLISFPILTLKFIKIYLSYKIRCKKAGKIFKKELLRQGLNKKTASQLTENFAQTISFREFAR